MSNLDVSALNPDFSMPNLDLFSEDREIDVKSTNLDVQTDVKLPNASFSSPMGGKWDAANPFLMVPRTGFDISPPHSYPHLRGVQVFWFFAPTNPAHIHITQPT